MGYKHNKQGQKKLCSLNKQVRERRPIFKTFNRIGKTEGINLPGPYTMLGCYGAEDRQTAQKGINGAGGGRQRTDPLLALAGCRSLV